MRSITARVSLDFISDLSAQLAHPKRDSDEEHGGILFGRILRPRVVEITGFEFLHSEHRRGTLYDLGARERARVSQHIRELNRRSGPKAIGYFRTHLRPGLFLDQDDFALMSEAFSDPSALALVIRPDLPGPPNAGLFFWENGDIDRKQSHFVFPFDEATLRVQGPIDVEAPEPRTGSPARPLLPNLKILRPSPGWIAALVLTALAMFAALRYRQNDIRAVTPLNLHVSRTGQALTVGWNSNAASIRDAAEATLTIEDSGTTQQIKLGPRELEHGNVQFWPRSNHIYVRMDIIHQNRVSESVTAVVNGEGAAPQYATTQPKPGVAETPAQEPAPEPVELAPPAENEPPANARPQSSRQQSTAQAAPKPSPFRPPEPEPEKPAEPAVVAAAPEPAPHVETSPPPVVSPAPRHERTVTVAVNMEPSQPSEIRKVVSHVPLLGHFQPFRSERGSEYTPPHPRHSLEPKVPDYMAANLSREIPVDVKVSIDKNGLVKNAEVMHGAGTGFGALAADSATEASWDPARIGDRRIPADVILHYRFRPVQ